MDRAILMQCLNCDYEYYVFVNDTVFIWQRLKRGRGLIHVCPFCGFNYAQLAEED